MMGRSPHGERGLKLEQWDSYLVYMTSLPARGAWVEMFNGIIDAEQVAVAPRTGSVG